MLDPDRDKKDEQQERRKLMMRAGIAAIVLLVLLVGLFLVDRRAKDEPATPEAVAGPEEASVSPPTIGISMTTSSTSSSSSSESSSESSSSSSSAISEELQQAIAEAPDTAQAALQKSPVKPRVTAGHASSQTAAPVASSTESILSVPQLPSGGPVRQPAENVATAQAATSSQAKSAPPEPEPPTTPIQVTPTPALPAGSYAVQLGVFANVNNAEELRERLRREGIPAQLETRVQVGPFRNRQEALRAQEKLRKLGLGRGMLVVAGKKS